MCRSFDKESGVTLPFKYFDPLGMSKVRIAWQIWQLWVKIVGNSKLGRLDENTKLVTFKTDQKSVVLRCFDLPILDPLGISPQSNRMAMQRPSGDVVLQRSRTVPWRGLTMFFYGLLIKGSWEAIFRVTDDFYSMKGGVLLYITSQ